MSIVQEIESAINRAALRLMSIKTKVQAFVAVIVATALFGICSLLGDSIYIHESGCGTTPTPLDPLVFFFADFLGVLYSMYVTHAIVVLTPVVFAYFLFRRSKSFDTNGD